MDLSLAGHTAVVAGGSSGIGRAVASWLAREGVTVIVCGRDKGRTRGAAEQVTTESGNPAAATCVGDLTESSVRQRAVAMAYEQTGRLDIVVNTTGTPLNGDPLGLPHQTFVDALAGKYLVQLAMSRTAADAMIAHGHGGVIVNVVGVGGVEPFPTHLPGGAANAALLLASKSLSHQLGPHGIRVVALSPGMVATEQRKAALAAAAKRDGVSVAEAEASVSATIPLGRIATVDDVAAAVTFFASPMASYFTGCHIVLDGGQTRAI